MHRGVISELLACIEECVNITQAAVFSVNEINIYTDRNSVRIFHHNITDIYYINYSSAHVDEFTSIYYEVSFTYSGAI